MARERVRADLLRRPLARWRRTQQVIEQDVPKLVGERGALAQRMRTHRNCNDYDPTIRVAHRQAMLGLVRRDRQHVTAGGRMDEVEQIIERSVIEAVLAAKRLR